MADGSSRSGSTDTASVLSTAQKLATALANAKQEREVLENAAKEFVGLFNSDFAAMLIAQPDGSGLVAGEFPPNSKLGGLEMSPDVRLISEHCARGLTTMVENISTSGLLSHRARETFLQAKLNSMALFPMGERDGRWIGAVILGMKGPLQLNITQTDTASALAKQLGGLVLAARQAERTHLQVAQFTELLRLSEQMAQVESEDDLAYQVASVIPSILPVKQFLVLRGNPYGPTLNLVSRWENGRAMRVNREQPVSVNTAGTLLGALSYTEALVAIPDFTAAQPPVSGLLQVPTRSGLAATLRLGEEAIGAIVAESDEPYRYSEADRAIFNQLVTQMNVAIGRLNAAFSLMRSANSSNAVNMVSDRMQGETSAQGVLNSGTLAAQQVLRARRVSVQLGNPNLGENGLNAEGMGE